MISARRNKYFSKEEISDSRLVILVDGSLAKITDMRWAHDETGQQYSYFVGNLINANSHRDKIFCWNETGEYFGYALFNSIRYALRPNFNIIYLINDMVSILNTEHIVYTGDIYG